MRKFKVLKVIKNNHGAAPVITALAIVFLLIAAAFVIDFGITYLKTASLQNAADSASLAAASLLPVSYDDTSGIQEVKQKAIEYIDKNDIAEDYTADIQLNLGENNLYTSVSVSINEKAKMFIAPVIGVTHLDVMRTATAQVSPAISVSNVVPLSITEEFLSQAKSSGTTQHLELKLGASDEDVLQGAFGALDLDGNVGGGANDYSDWLKNGYQGTLRIGQQLPVETGNMSNPTMDAFQKRYDKCTHYPSDGGCTIEHFTDSCPRVVIVPVISYDSPHQVTIKGFSAFVIENCAGQGNNSIITGSFVSDILVNGDGSLDDPLGGSADYGIYAITLIE